MSERRVYRSLRRDNFLASALHPSDPSEQGPLFTMVGESVGKFIAPIQDSLRGHPDFDVIVGGHYVWENDRTYKPAIRLLVRPSVTRKELKALMKNIPKEVPVTIPIVYKRWDNLTPKGAMDKKTRHPSRVTHTGERIKPSFD